MTKSRRPPENSGPLADIRNRRRPGRIANVSPSLVPLLRREALANLPVMEGRSDNESRSKTPAVSPARMAGVMAGTRFLTPQGYKPVETLRKGDLVGVLIGRGPVFVPITWVGRRAVSDKARTGSDVLPVRIRRNAIADRMPSRDVWLAPEHALYLEGSLYLIRQLANGRSILFDRNAKSAEYWGIQLERHDILLAENLAIESLLPASTQFFTEVVRPHLTVVGISKEDADPEPAALNFPARMKMSARWFRRRMLWLPSTAVPLDDPDGSVDQASADKMLDIAHEVRVVLQTFTKIAIQRGIRFETAIGSGLAIRMDQKRFRELLGAIATHVIYGSAGGRVLVGAMHHAGRLQVAFISDAEDSSQQAQQAELRPVEELASRQGGSIEVEVRPREGSTVLLRLPSE